MKHYSTSPSKEIERPLKSPDMKSIVGKWYASFIQALSSQTLVDLVSAANYMDIKPLFELMCATIASMIQGKTPKEVQGIFSVSPNDESSCVASSSRDVTRLVKFDESTAYYLEFEDASPAREIEEKDGWFSCNEVTECAVTVIMQDRELLERTTNRKACGTLNLELRDTMDVAVLLRNLNKQSFKEKMRKALAASQGFVTSLWSNNHFVYLAVIPTLVRP